jgi:hypothetical protein
MKTLKNMILATVASSLVFFSANAGEMSIDGSIEMAHTVNDGETGNPLGMENEMTMSAATELDNGVAVSYKMTLDANAFDDEEISFATDYGNIALTSTGSPLDANDNITPTVFEEAEYGAGTGYLDTSALAGNGAMLIRYGNTFMGVGIDASYTPRYGSGDGSDDGSASATTGSAYGKVYEVALSAVPLDGAKITVGYGLAERDALNLDDGETGLVALSYAYGPISVGAQKTILNYGNAGKARATGTNWVKNLNVGISYSVNDQLSVSYQETTSQRSATSVVNPILKGSMNNTVELEADTISVGYTIGGMSIKYAESDVDNDTYSTGTKGSKTHEGLVLLTS